MNFSMKYFELKPLLFQGLLLLAHSLNSRYVFLDESVYFVNYPVVLNPARISNYLSLFINLPIFKSVKIILNL
jgi:hypothetical protein